MQDMEIGSSVLAGLLSKNSGLRISKDFTTHYQITNMGKAAEIFTAKLLIINGLESSSTFKDEVLVTATIEIHSSTINQGLVETAKE